VAASLSERETATPRHVRGKICFFHDHSNGDLPRRAPRWARQLLESALARRCLCAVSGQRTRRRPADESHRRLFRVRPDDEPGPVIELLERERL